MTQSREDPPWIANFPNSPSFASYAEAVLESRRRLSAHVPGGWFADPAFDMLLDLYVASERGEVRRVSAVVSVSGVPPATALRWIGSLVSARLVERQEERPGGPRTLLRLSPQAARSLRAWLSETSSIPLRRELGDRAPTRITRPG